jgi:hypothetical protein
MLKLFSAYNYKPYTSNFNITHAGAAYSWSKKTAEKGYIATRGLGNILHLSQQIKLFIMHKLYNGLISIWCAPPKILFTPSESFLPHLKKFQICSHPQKCMD